jgi:hypothetical protein
MRSIIIVFSISRHNYLSLRPFSPESLASFLQPLAKTLARSGGYRKLETSLFRQADVAAPKTSAGKPSSESPYCPSAPCAASSTVAHPAFRRISLLFQVDKVPRQSALSVQAYIRAHSTRRLMLRRTAVEAKVSTLLPLPTSSHRSPTTLLFPCSFLLSLSLFPH